MVLVERNLRKLLLIFIKNYRMDILVVCEPRVPFARLEKFFSKLGFPDVFFL